MGQLLNYLHERFWVTEGSVWRPPEPITLRDEAGVPIGNALMSSMLMTLYNVETDAIVNGVDGTVSVMDGQRSCTLSAAGIYILTLLPADTVMLDSTLPYERRRALIRYQWPFVPTKADALQIDLVIRNLHRLP